MDIPHKKRPDVYHVSRMKWLHQEMTGSRSFLLVLLLATVTCILLIQMSMDNWIHPSRSLGFYNVTFINLDNSEHEERPKKLKVTSEATSKSTSKTTVTSLPVTLPPAIPTILRVVTSIRTVTSPPRRINNALQTNDKIRNFIREREKKLNATYFLNQKRAVINNHQAKLQDIIRRKNALRRTRPDPMKRIQIMPIVSPEKVNRIFLITYFRTGSSFLGELLQQNSRTFYQYEPLHYMTYGTRISSSNQTKEALELLNSIYRCNFSNLGNYFDWVKKPKNRFLFSRSLFLWFTCRTNPSACFRPDYVSAVCKRTPIQVVKTTRLNMWQLKLFLERNPDLNIKVVYLTRDPRGIISSRWTLADWCNGTECSDPDVICSEMKNDIEIFNELQNKEPTKFIQIRYEDMTMNPENETKHLLEFLNLSFSQTVRNFLKSHTNAKKTDNLDPYSTRRNSSSMAYSWKRRVNFQQAQTIQKYCSDVIRQLNYSLINSPDELENANSVPNVKEKSQEHLINKHSFFKINKSNWTENINFNKIKNVFPFVDKKNFKNDNSLLRVTSVETLFDNNNIENNIIKQT